MDYFAGLLDDNYSAVEEEELQALVNLKSFFCDFSYGNIGTCIGNGQLKDMLNQHGARVGTLIRQLCSFLASSEHGVATMNTIEGTICISYLVQLMVDEDCWLPNADELNFIL